MVLHWSKPTYVDQCESALRRPLFLGHSRQGGSAIVDAHNLSCRGAVRVRHIVSGCVADADDPIAKASRKGVLRLSNEVVGWGHQAMPRRYNTGNARHSGSDGSIDSRRRVVKMYDIGMRFLED